MPHIVRFPLPPLPPWSHNLYVFISSLFYLQGFLCVSCRNLVSSAWAFYEASLTADLHVWMLVLYPCNQAEKVTTIKLHNFCFMDFLSTQLEHFRCSALTVLAPPSLAMRDHNVLKDFGDSLLLYGTRLLSISARFLSPAPICSSAHYSICHLSISLHEWCFHGAMTNWPEAKCHCKVTCNCITVIRFYFPLHFWYTKHTLKKDYNGFLVNCENILWKSHLDFGIKVRHK